MSHFLRGLLATTFISIAIPAWASPILSTVSCDSTGLYTCLTGVENFQVGEELYNARFIPGNIVDVFNLDKSGDLLEQLQPLENALFWDDLEGAQTFATALAALLVANDIDGFLCSGRCEFERYGLPYEYTYIPVYLSTTVAMEVSDCFVGRTPTTGEEVHHCPYNPGGNTLNWAVISKVPEPDILLTLGIGVVAVMTHRFGSMSISRRRPRSSSATLDSPS